MSQPTPQSASTIALVADMLLASRISGAARAAGVSVLFIRNPRALAGADGRRLLVDLNLPGAIEAARDWSAAAPDRTVIGFVSHVDAATATTARAAGLSQVVARSRFVQLLEVIFREGPPT